MNHGGRPLHDYWQIGEYENRTENGRSVAFCLRCKKTLRNTAKKRLETHRTNCNDNSGDVSQPTDELNIIGRTDTNENFIGTFQLDIASSSNQQTSNVIAMGTGNFDDVPLLVPNLSISALSSQEQSNPVSTTSSVFPASKLRSQTKDSQKRKFDTYFDSVSLKDKARIDEALIKFLYAENIPFDIITSRRFLDFLKAMRPAYEPPSTADISSALHDFHAQMKQYHSTSESSRGVLIIRRTENQQSSSVIAFVRTSRKTTIYLRTWKVQKDTLTVVIADAITLASENFKLQIYAVISNEDIQSIAADELSDLWILQCNISFAEYIEQKLVDLQFADKVRKLLYEFSTADMEKSLIARGGKDTKLEYNSRCQFWSLYSTCMDNLEAMTQMVGDRSCKLKKDVVDILLDQSFEDTLRHSLNLLTPLYSIVQKCERVDVTLAEIIEDWLVLASTENRDYTSVRIEIEKIFTPIALVANLLHPTYRGQRFAHDRVRNTAVMKLLIEKLTPSEMDGFTEYKDSKGIFGLPRLRTYEDGASFWRAVSPVHSSLSEFVVRILELPAAAPKLQSYPVNVNDLTPKRFGKLTDLFYHLNM